MLRSRHVRAFFSEPCGFDEHSSLRRPRARRCVLVEEVGGAACRAMFTGRDLLHRHGHRRNRRDHRAHVLGNQLPDAGSRWEGDGACGPRHHHRAQRRRRSRAVRAGPHHHEHGVRVWLHEPRELHRDARAGDVDRPLLPAARRECEPQAADRVPLRLHGDLGAEDRHEALDLPDERIDHRGPLRRRYPRPVAHRGRPRRDAPTRSRGRSCRSGSQVGT